MSARQFADLAAGLAERGWDVTACPANRDFPEGSRTYPRREDWNGVAVRRVWRPNWDQARNFGRLANAAWMITAWGLQSLVPGRRRPDIVVIGTDPVLSVCAAVPWRLTGTRVVHWAFDIYPEAAIADGMTSDSALPVRFLRFFLRRAYRACHLIVDIGPCMRDLIRRYGSPARTETITPWALVEPAGPVTADPAIRAGLFGDASLGLLYSGTFGRAHSHEDLLALARAMRGSTASFCFAGRGNRTEQLRAAVTPDDTNVRFAGFASADELEQRLGAADVHLVSLQPSWTGTVVPSKFFGSLAIGRPVVFSGSAECGIARWVKEHRVGWLLNSKSVNEVAQELKALAENPARLKEMQSHCQAVYQSYFARERMIDAWDAELRALLPARAPAPVMP
ncbi:MAG: glycosyltransferase family 4 protein [Gemmataceae bacterium]|nr:glycosyltransferase family 4 protein [Gemmataceae bacterium]